MFEQTANDCDRTIGDRRFVAEKIETVSDAFGANFLNRNMNVDDLFELNRVAVIAFGVNAGPTDLLPFDFADYAQAKTAQQRVFGLLHVSEEVRKVHDAGSVGVAKFDSSLSFKNLWHHSTFVALDESKCIKKACQ